MKANYEKGLYKQYEDTVALLDKLNAKMDAMESRREAEIAQIKAEHQQEVAALKKEIQVRDEKIQELTAKNEALTEEVSRLKSIINNDSHNSSNPPSSDQKPGHKNANEYNSRHKSDKKQGAQGGHKGITLTRNDVEAMLASGKCEHKVKNIGMVSVSSSYVTRYVVSICVTPVVTEYRIYPNARGRFDIPDFLRGTVTYGNELKAMVIALYGIGVVSNDRIADFIRGITDNVIRIATGTVYRFCRCFSDMSTHSLQNIECGLLNHEVLHTDATTVTIDGVQSYIRNVSANDVVMYYDMPKKTAEEIEKISVLKSHTGVVVHDHETAMYRLPAMHAECNVHILRYLEKNTQETGNEWGKRMESLLIKANHDRKLRIASGETAFSSDEIRQYEQEYDTILEDCMNQNRTTKPKWAKREEASLLRRLVKYKENHLMFLHNFKVSFDNNLSERDLRKCKNRQKMSGGFRTQDGCGMFCDILSIIETARRQDTNVYAAILDVFCGKVLFQINAAAEL